LGAFVVVSACDRPSPTNLDERPDVRQFVTGAAAKSLDNEGVFQLPAPVAPDTVPIISAERATDLAVSFVLSFGPATEKFWEEDRGGRVDFRTLKPDPRVFYASTPYELFPAGYHPSGRRAFGPFYLVQMVFGSEPLVTVAVSAYNMDVLIDNEGKLNRPVLSGSDFLSQGVSRDTTKGYLPPLTPEQAAIRVGRLTGARVSDVPEFVLPGFPLSPLHAAWKLILDRKVRVRTVRGSRTAEVRELYLGGARSRTLLIPALEQPSEWVTMASRITPEGERRGAETVRLLIQADHPTVFEEVVVN
jgi:hypothetical protein